jgi:ribosomal protein S12 methylthiotransferase accessory factor
MKTILSLPAPSCTFTWSDPLQPGIVYETQNFGKTHTLLRMGQDLALSDSARALSVIGLHITPRLWLVRTPFCAPRVWWEYVALHPEATILPTFFHRGHLLIGPGFTSRGPVCPTCTGLRLGQAFPHPAVFAAILSSPIAINGSPDAYQKVLDQDALTSFALCHRDQLSAGTCFSIPLLEGMGEAQWHALLPPPGEHPTHLVDERTQQLFGIPAGTVPRLHQVQPIKPPTLLDPLVGPLVSTTRVPSEPGEPVGLAGYATVTGHLGKYTRWKADVSGSGLNFSSEMARWASLGEAVERYAGNYPPLDRLLYASESELVNAGRSHVSMRHFRQFTQTQETSRLWPFAPLRVEQPIPWIEGESLGQRGEPVLLPAEGVCLNLNRVTKQPSQIPVPLAGIAAHRSREAAIAAALLELVERDASMLWWHGRLPPWQLIGLPSDLLAQIENGVPASLRQWFLLLRTDLPAFVVAGCLHDVENEILVVGFAARPRLSDALLKAISEAWQLRRLSLQLLDRESALWKAVDVGSLPMPVRPFRADRCYGESFQSDWCDMHQLAYNLQFFLDPATHVPAFARLHGEPHSYEEAVAKQTAVPGDFVARCLACLERSGEHAYCVDLATPDTHALGFETVRVGCTGLVGNAPTAFVPLTHPRLLRVLREQGAHPYLAPMPHA